jgi:hypothetical protein
LFKGQISDIRYVTGIFEGIYRIIKRGSDLSGHIIFSGHESAMLLISQRELQ